MNSLILPQSSCQVLWLSACLGGIVAESTGVSGGQHEGDEGVVSRANAVGTKVHTFIPRRSGHRGALFTVLVELSTLSIQGTSQTRSCLE